MENPFLKLTLIILGISLIVFGLIYAIKGLVNDDGEVRISDTREEIPVAISTESEVVTTPEGYSFSYPINFETEYIDPLDWPPRLLVYNQPYVCTEGGSLAAEAGKTEERIINGRSYCITEILEGAAGSVYSQNAYITPYEGKTLIFVFTMRWVQCANFDAAEMERCEEERAQFSVDKLVDEMVKSVSFLGSREGV